MVEEVYGEQGYFFFALRLLVRLYEGEEEELGQYTDKVMTREGNEGNKEEGRNRHSSSSSSKWKRGKGILPSLGSIVMTSAINGNDRH